MLQKTFDWIERYADHKNAKRALAVIAFAESSFFPIPPFVMIVAMLAHENKPSWIKISTIGMVASVLGGVAAYFIGKFFYGYVGEPLVVFYGVQEQVNSLGSVFREHVFTTIFLASLSPIPYKVFTLSAGLFSVNIWMFILASIVGRSMRFFAVGYIANKYGARGKKMILEQQKHFTVLFVVIVCVIVGYYFLNTKGIL